MRTASYVSRFTFYVPALIALLLLSAACAAPEAEDDTLTASGFIEGEEVTVAAETPGLIVEILAERGDQVQTGDLMVRLDDATLRSQRAEAEAALSAARADLARVQSGARTEDIAAARASLDEAQARRQGARQAVLNARDVISNPLEIEAQIDEARAQVDLAEQNVELQEADLEATKTQRSVYTDRGGDVAATWDLQVQAAQARLEKAEAQLQGAQAYLGALLAIRANPLTLEAELHQAEARYEMAETEVAQAEAKLAELEAGPTAEDVAVAEAQVRQAQAGIQLIDARLDQLTLEAPMDGIVSTRSAQEGETATAGKPLLTIANLDEVTLVIYIPENRIGQVNVGQEVQVTVDSFPERTFIGQVKNIAGEAEFTPRNVQTEEERVNLVFAVDVSIPNPDQALKPGMPADATIVP
jgi:multidrug resistance efflux pump